MVKRAYFVLVIFLLLFSITFVLAESSYSDVYFKVSVTDILPNENGYFSVGLYVIIISLVLGILFRIFLREYYKKNRYKRAIKVRDK